MLNYYIMILCNAITTVTQLPCALRKESFYTKSAAGRETNMNEENRITLILIDTCAFREANSDFPGIVKSLLPSFFSTVDEKGIALLTHPVLENEIRKHIEDSSIFKDYQSLLNQGNICIDCEGASIREIDEEELSVRALREDKGYPRRNTK